MIQFEKVSWASNILNTASWFGDSQNIFRTSILVIDEFKILPDMVVFLHGKTFSSCWGNRIRIFDTTSPTSCTCTDCLPTTYPSEQVYEVHKYIPLNYKPHGYVSWGSVYPSKSQQWSPKCPSASSLLHNTDFMTEIINTKISAHTMVERERYGGGGVRKLRHRIVTYWSAVGWMVWPQNSSPPRTTECALLWK